jgi:hypothetical protein
MEPPRSLPHIELVKKVKNEGIKKVLWDEFLTTLILLRKVQILLAQQR